MDFQFKFSKKADEIVNKEKLHSHLMEFEQEHGDTVGEENSFELDIWVVATWACIWNNPKLIGATGFTVALTNKFVVVLFPEEKTIGIYRPEDLIEKPKE